MARQILAVQTSSAPASRQTTSPSRRRIHASAAVALLACLGLSACGSNQEAAQEPNPTSASPAAVSLPSATPDATDPFFNRATEEENIKRQYQAYLKATAEMGTMDEKQVHARFTNLVTDDFFRDFTLVSFGWSKGSEKLQRGSYKANRYRFVKLNKDSAVVLTCQDNSDVRWVIKKTGQEQAKSKLSQFGVKNTYVKSKDGYWLIANEEGDLQGKKTITMEACENV